MITMFFKQSFAQMESFCVSNLGFRSFIERISLIRQSNLKHLENKNNRIRNKNLNIAGNFVKKREIFF